MKEKIAIVGATGLVGLEMQKILKDDPELSSCELLLLASTSRPDQKIFALEDSWESLSQCRFILGAAENSVALEVGRKLRPGQYFVDNSSAFRMQEDLCLGLPEVNREALLKALKKGDQIFANPNCTAILLCMTLGPLRKWGLERVVVSTYQAASGAGLKGLEELQTQVKADGQGLQAPQPVVFPYKLHLNVMSHNSAIRSEGWAQGYNDEESKVIEESRKILELPDLSISATCMRVPVYRAHTEAVTVDLRSDFNVEEVRNLFSSSPGLKLVDEPEKKHFPMPLEAENQDFVLVGRLRKDPFRSRTLHYILSGDQIRKGAATNAIQILKFIRSQI